MTYGTMEILETRGELTDLRMPMNTVAPPSRSASTFFLLLLALSLPLWVIAGLTGLQLSPGLPVSAFMFVCPVTAASILAYRENKAAGVTTLLKRSFDYARIRSMVWYIPILLLMPGVTILTYALMRVMGLPLHPPPFTVLAALATFVVFFIAASGEELGWSGYIIDPIQARWTALGAALLVGLVWAVWHWVPLMQVHRPIAWIAWWSLGTVSLRVIIVWLYNNTGRSVFAAALFHATTNVSSITFSGYYDPRITGAVLALIAAIIAGASGPHTLVRHRHASDGAHTW